MKHLKYLCLACACWGLSAAASTQPDDVSCQFGSALITASYDFDAKLLSVQISQGGTVKAFKGIGYQILKATEVLANAAFVGTANNSKISLADLGSAAEFVIFDQNNSTFFLLKFLDKSGNPLGIAGINATMPFTCQ